MSIIYNNVLHKVNRWYILIINHNDPKGINKWLLILYILRYNSIIITYHGLLSCVYYRYIKYQSIQWGKKTISNYNKPNEFKED